jgi:hypothetical protein
MAGSVFFSFAGRDEGWVEQFAGKRFFARPLSAFEIYIYSQPGQALPFGNLDEFLEHRIDNSAAVLVFFSENYIRSLACMAELNRALDTVLTRNLIFVPIILDLHGRKYWSNLKNSPTYAGTFRNYTASDFTELGRAQRIYIRGIEELDVTLKIEALAEEIAAKISLLQAPAPDPDPDPDPAVIAGEPIRPGPLPGLGNLVLLGDPSHDMPDIEIAQNFDALSHSLEDVGVAYKAWPHAWRRKGGGAQDRLKLPATFLRVATRLDIDDEADSPCTLKWINNSGRVDGVVKDGVILWQPSQDAVAWPLASPMLRQDSVEVLARWLLDCVVPTPGEPDPLLLIIDEPQFDAIEDAPYADVVRMVSDLTSMKFRGRSMNAEEFNRFIVGNQHRRLIIAVLDNNVNMTEFNGSNPLERFEDIIERWQDEISDINQSREDDGQEKMDVKWVAVMARLAQLNPLSTWNKRTLEPIHVLRILRETDPGGGQVYVPDQSSAQRVAAFLKRWASPSSARSA